MSTTRLDRATAKLEGAKEAAAQAIKGNLHKEINCHYWLELPDGTIIDATASQFRRRNHRAMPLVYIGELPEWYDPKWCGRTDWTL